MIRQEADEVLPFISIPIKFCCGSNYFDIELLHRRASAKKAEREWLKLEPAYVDVLCMLAKKAEDITC